MSTRKVLFLLSCAFVLAGGVYIRSADAASLFLLPKSSAFNIGEEFAIDLKANAVDEFLNATQATVQFSNDVLELTGIDKSGSSFNFWVEEPVISNETGTVSFIGGTTRGISGASLQILRLKFKTKGAGVATLTVSDAVVTASDGKGTNILSVAEDASIRVGTQTVPAVAPGIDQVPVIEPSVIERVPSKAIKTPLAPQVTVPLYAATDTWYSTQGDVIALWDVPEDVTGVGVVLDESPETVPTKLEDKLSNGKKFGVLKEGTWYIHVRFKNSLGWGRTAHYRINIDTTAPLSFDATISAEASDNPTPEIKFVTADSLSGIDDYQVFLDNEQIARTADQSLVLPPLVPGPHTVRVRASDKAGNSTESVLMFEILPLPTPLINFYTETISQSEALFVSGTTVPLGTLVYSVRASNGTEVTNGAVAVDATGGWEFRTADPIRRSGNYSFTVKVFDTRGAQSFSTSETSFRVRALVLFSIGSIDIGWFEILLLVLLCILVAVMWFVLITVKRNSVRGAYSTVIGRDVEKFATMLKEEIDEVKKKVSLKKTIEDTQTRSEVLYRIEKLQDIVAKMKKYLGQEITKMKK